MENTTERRWIDVKAAAVYLGATVTFVRSLLWDGEVPFVRAGKKFIVAQRSRCLHAAKERAQSKLIRGSFRGKSLKKQQQAVK
jgi:excisionase family DNA binding protein